MIHIEYIQAALSLEKRFVRQAYWFHGRHYLVDAYLVDHRVEDVLILTNTLFYIERVFFDMHNIAIERCFRHIAIGCCNWLHSGSHFAAQNIAFMFGLLESCKLNNINFGEYIEDILTRFLFGKQADESFLPCNYEPQYLEGKDVA